MCFFGVSTSSISTSSPASFFSFTAFVLRFSSFVFLLFFDDVTAFSPFASSDNVYVPGALANESTILLSTSLRFLFFPCAGSTEVVAARFVCPLLETEAGPVVSATFFGGTYRE